MRGIGEFISDAEKEFPDELEGRQTMGGFDGPPLAMTRQYRARVARGEWRQANTSGKWSFSITFEIVEDPHGEFVGRKFSEYYSIDKGAHEAARRAFSRFLGESGLDIPSISNQENEDFIKNFEDITYVVATRTWGDDGDNTGIRYLNRDRGQKLQENIKPPKAPGSVSKPLRADINIKKEEEPFPETAPLEEAAAAPQVSLPGTGSSRPPGVNLPPGLAR